MIAENPVDRPSAKDILIRLKEIEKVDKKCKLFKQTPKSKVPRERSL
jgi:hypothetical protein